MRKQHNAGLWHMIRPFDVILVLGLLLASFIPYVIFAHHENQAQRQAKTAQVLTAVVSHDGKTVYKIRLSGHQGTTRFRYQHGNDWNEIETSGESIRVSAADCQDQVCVRKSKISKAGETIVCLPHKLLIEIRSDHGTSRNTGGVVSE